MELNVSTLVTKNELSKFGTKLVQTMIKNMPFDNRKAISVIRF